MQGVQPETLTDEELLRYTYLQLGKPLPQAWALELYARLYRMYHHVKPPEYESLRIALIVANKNT